LQQVEPAKRAVYRYNFAAANEKLGNWEQAYNNYLAAIADKPEYQSASEAAFRLLRNRPEPRIAEAVKFSETLLSTGQTESAERYTKQYLDLWGKQPGSQQLLAALLQYYAVAPLTLEMLQTREWVYLQQLAGSAPGLGQPIANIRVARFDSFSPVFEPFQARELVPAWANEEWQQRAMAGMLKRTGDLFRQAGKFREALAGYSAAWALAGDSEAALYAASLLHEQRQLIDSNGQLFNQLLQGIFEVKGMQYSKQDWPNILRLHTILGTIFEQEQKWGSESDSHSAIFQWRHAISAEEQVRRGDPKFPRSPMLYMKLASAYRETGNRSAALDLYLSAAEAFVEASNPQQATVAMKQAQSLDVKIPPAAQERIQKIDFAIRTLSSTTASLKRSSALDVPAC
jgi:tetratricopeptide (TPR) repeat protein